VDIGIEGQGFFEIILPDGTSAYKPTFIPYHAAGEVVTAKV
jgi:flagellar basal body rod protein FlgG